LDTLNAQKGFFYQVPLIAGSTQPEPDPTQNILSATIDGEEFDAQIINVSNANNTILINGVNGIQTITLTFPNDITPGVNQIGPDVSAQYILDGEIFDAISGNVSILIHDTNTMAVSGTFSFETEGDIPFVIEEGVFSVTYQ